MAKVTAEVITPSNLDGLPDGTTYKRATGTQLTKLDGVETAATADQTGAEIQTAIVGLADADRKVMVSNPLTGEFKIYGIHRNAALNLEYDYESVAT